MLDSWQGGRGESTRSQFSDRMRVGMVLLTLQVAFTLEEMPLGMHSRSVGDGGKSMRLGVRGRFSVPPRCQLAV